MSGNIRTKEEELRLEKRLDLMQVLKTKFAFDNVIEVNNDLIIAASGRSRLLLIWKDKKPPIAGGSYLYTENLTEQEAEELMLR